MSFESPRQFFPNAFKAFLKQSFKQCLGLGLLALVLISAAAYVSYNPQDASLNAVSNVTVISNWLGISGAILADLLVQLFGYSTILLLFILWHWGWKLWQH
jgi:S-DNA-T family DNA segregation ATPase FtsK/SpoIIIE